MLYRYTRINARGDKELHYTKDIDIALVYDPNPVPCIGNIPRSNLARNIGTGFICAALLCALTLALFGPELVQFCEDNDDILSGLCVFFLLGTAVGTFLCNMHKGDDE